MVASDVSLYGPRRTAGRDQTSCGSRALVRFLSRPRRSRHMDRRGLTLMELLLSLALTALVLIAIGAAIDMHLTTLDTRRGHVEETQLARAVLKMIADDIHNSVAQNTLDFSSFEEMVLGGLSGSLPAALGGATGGGGSGGDSGTGGGTGGGGTGGGGTGQSSGGGQAGSGTGSSGTGGGESGDVEGMDTENMDVSTTAAPADKPGLYGNQYQLLVDVSRIPRVDEYVQLAPGSALQPLVDVPSAVKSVAYYVQGTGAGGATAGFSRNTGREQTGLVRRSLDRLITSYAALNGNLTSLEGAGEMIAPEVTALEFRYYDGVEWLTEWDSMEMEGLPLAVTIMIWLRPAKLTREQLLDSSGTGSSFPEKDLFFSTIVRLPTVDPTAPTDEDLSAMGL